MISATGHSIAIVPVGSFELELIERISSKIERIFGFTSEIMPLMNDLSFAFDADRKQYHSTKIIAHLANKIPATVIKALAIVKVDLFIPILTHVYGEAQLGGKACIVSIYRLNERCGAVAIGEPFRGRILKEAIHELGHTFTLRHCKDPRCLMHYCRTEKDVDHKSEELCRYCRILLEDELKKRGTADVAPPLGVN